MSPLDAAARLVEMRTKLDQARLRDMFASPCDLFGELSNQGSVELKKFCALADKSIQIEITKAFQLAPGDPHTVEFEYVKTWTQGSHHFQVQAGEFLTFTPGFTPRVVRIGYSRQPSKTVVVAPGGRLA